MADFDFEKLQSNLTNVNNVLSILAGGVSLIGNAQQEALKSVSELAQAYQQLKAELEEKDMKIAELEAELAKQKED